LGKRVAMADAALVWSQEIGMPIWLTKLSVGKNQTNPTLTIEILQAKLSA
jgi:hypothetical protein